RLGVEGVDLYLAHDWDPDVPVAELAGVFEELVAAGTIGAYGLSNVDGAQLAEALEAGAFAAVQDSHSLLAREAERDVLPLCAPGARTRCAPAAAHASRPRGVVRAVHLALRERDEVALAVSRVDLARARDLLLRVGEHLLPLGEPAREPPEREQHGEVIGRI